MTEGEGTERLRAAISAFAAQAAPQPDLPFPARYEGVYQERRREWRGAQCSRGHGALSLRSGVSSLARERIRSRWRTRKCSGAIAHVRS